MTVEHEYGDDHTNPHRRKRFRCPDARNSVNACATTAEIVLPDSRARARTRATSAAGNLTVNTVVSSGTTAGPPAAARSAYRRAWRTEQPNRPAKHPRRLCRRHPGNQQLRSGVDPPRVLPATDTTTSITDIRHDIAVLPDMSRFVGDTPRSLHPSIPKRDIETEVAHCVEGVLSPLLANVALSVLDEHFAEAPGGPRSTTKQRWTRRHKGLPNYRLFRYADLCRVPHKSAYADRRIMPTAA